MAATKAPVAAVDTGNLTDLSHKYPGLVDLYAQFEPRILLVDRSITPLWYLTGLFGNLLSAYVWMHPRVRKNNSSAVYLAALSVWDLAFLTLHTIQEVREAWSWITNYNLFTCSILPVLLLTAQYLSPVLVLCFTMERWIAVWFPFKRDSLCTPMRACIVTACVVLGVLAWNLVQFHFNEFIFETNECARKMDTVEWSKYTTATEAIFSGIVPITALFFNILVAKELHRIIVSNKNLMPTGESGDNSAERRFRTTTVMLLCVSLFTILTTLPAGLMYALQNQTFGNTTFTDEQVVLDPVWQSYFQSTLAKKIVDEVSISHYSLNFIIYLLTGPQYRSYARQLLDRMLGPLRDICCSCCSKLGLTGVCCQSGGKSGQRQEKLRAQEQYYLSHSLTDRAKRLANHRAILKQGGSVEEEVAELWNDAASQSERGNGGGAARAGEIIPMSEMRKPLLLTSRGNPV